MLLKWQAYGRNKVLLKREKKNNKIKIYKISVTPVISQALETTSTKRKGKEYLKRLEDNNKNNSTAKCNKTRTIHSQEKQINREGAEEPKYGKMCKMYDDCNRGET